MKFIFLFIIGYFSGSLMFCYWLGKLAGKDITRVGDGNPGAYNLFKAGGPVLGTAGLILDFLKGFFPLYYVKETGFLSGLSEVEFALVASSPLLGHAFSPFFRFKGGKGIAVTFGIWSALTFWKVPVVMGGVLTVAYFSGMDDRSFYSALAATATYLYFTHAASELWMLWLINFFVFVLKRSQISVFK